MREISILPLNCETTSNAFIYLLTSIAMGRKNKRGARSSSESTEFDQASSKRFQEESNAVATESSEEVEEAIEDNQQIRGMLVEIQITVSDIQRKQNHFAEELITLRNNFKLQKTELASTKSELEKVKSENTRLQRELEDVRMKDRGKTGRRNRGTVRPSRRTVPSP